MAIFALALLSAAIFVFILSWHVLGFLSLVALVPIFLLLERSSSKTNKKRTVILLSWAIGVVFFSSLLWWGLSANPEIWQLNSIDSVVTSYRVVAWLITVITLASSFALFSYVVQKKKLLLSNLSAFIYIPALWVFFEWLRSFFLSILFWAPEKAQIGADFNIGSLGYLGANSPLAPIARIGGLYGLAFCVVLANLIIFYAITKKRKNVMAGLSMLVLFLSISYLFAATPKAKPVEVAAVKLATNQSVFNDQTVSELVNNKQVEAPDITVLPEYATLFETGYYDRFRQLIINSSSSKSGLYVSSIGEFSKDNGHRNVLTYINEKGEIINSQVKSFLIPFGEYLPSVAKFSLEKLGKWNFLEEFNVKRSFVRSKTSEYPVAYAETKVGGIACSGVIAPRLYRELAQNGAEILTNSASLEAFEGSRAYKNHSRDFALFHAVANGRPFIQSTRGGQSLIIDHTGKVLVSSSFVGPQVIRSSVFPVKTKTPYIVLGEWVLPLSIIATMWVFAGGKISRLFSFLGRQKKRT